MMKRALLAAAVMLSSAAGEAAPITIDDLMKLRTIVDVRISPDGQTVAYVVSSPNLAANEHESKRRLS